MIISVFISTLRRMRSWATFRKYEGIRLNTSDSMMFVVSNGRMVCKITTGKKRSRLRPLHPKSNIRMNSLRAMSLIKSGNNSVIKLLNS